LNFTIKSIEINGINTNLDKIENELTSEIDIAIALGR